MNVRSEWGKHGLEASFQTADVFVIVDVLSFSTAVTVAAARGAKIYPTGGHCGNIDYEENVDYMVGIFADQGSR